MNNTFNINRFGLLLKRQWLEFGKIYLMSLVVLTGIIIAFYFFNIPDLNRSLYRWDDHGHVQLGFRLPTFMAIGFLFLTIVASTYFNAFGQKPKAIMELMTPASVTEKFICAILFSTILSLISYLLIFYIVDAIFLNYFNELWQHNKATNYNTGKLTAVSFSTLFDDLTSEREFKFFFALPFFFSSIFLLGSIYFNRFHYIKTALSVTALFSFIIFLTIKFGNLMTEGKTRVYAVDYLEKDFVFKIFFWSSVALSLIIWLITYVRLKEKEV
ncbi:hypothetical protein SAMN04488511_108229 [Pedobacter suwonensis]|uniref:ABC-2 family transporter protein n=1 Tax=Pedobacter suwonensis TaxID=332999 RepID=A0A1I0TDH9_9SPHI|nr:hypothetical protein [Pedobacter suwonensis]SFA49844.1 hypothetical protein SAMN04488511_108229 [Pedobacter suwonensis]